jgi:hypothetical protein
MKGTLLVSYACLILFVSSVCSASQSKDWKLKGNGDWKAGSYSMHQKAGDVTGEALFLRTPNTGRCWRVIIELSPGADEAGLRFAASGDGKSGYLLTLGKNGFVLQDTEGKNIWEDSLVPWSHYVSYVLEAVLENNRVRVQMLSSDGFVLISQSDWIKIDTKFTGNLLGLYCCQAVARFYYWERVEKPTYLVVPNAPNKLRLVQQRESDWTVVGPGNWQWTNVDKKVLRQSRKIERSSAIRRIALKPEGTWRCLVKVDPKTGGAGMLLQTNGKASEGFLVWLGGKPGAGALMLYRQDKRKSLWSSGQGKWRYGIEYMLEGTIRDGKVSVRLLESAGRVVIASSPAFDLLPEEENAVGFLGFQTWKGTAQFQKFSLATHAK